jgi:ectoine hydroxylase-related dioxygenase (phytanoyl-CoA dioxygenase family)
MTESLPVPTPDLAQARLDLERHGFCILKDALSDDLCSAIRSRVVEQAAGEAVLGMGLTDGEAPDRYILGSGRGERANRRVWTLVNKGAVFQRLLTHPDVSALIGHLLGTPYLLASMQANFVAPGDDPLPLHSDQGWAPRPWPPYPLTASAIWMLDDFTEDNGATSVIPQTHVEHPDEDPGAAMARARLIRRGGIPVTGPRGSALVLDGRLVHRTGVNTTDETRLGILTYFCRPFIRPQENYTLSTAPHLRANLPEEVQTVLGFRIWKALGSVEGVCAEGAFVDQPAAPVGPLDATGRPYDHDPSEEWAPAREHA